MNRYVLDLPVFSVLAVLHLYDDGATSCADRILITELGLRLTDRSVWSQTANDIQPDVIQYYLLPVAPTNSSRLYHRSTIGCPLPTDFWFQLPYYRTWHVKFDTGWRVFLRWPRVPVGMLKGPTGERRVSCFDGCDSSYQEWMLRWYFL